MAERLHLLVTDEEDLKVASACLQDALTRVGDMAFLAAQRRFVAVFSRFRWEQDGSSGRRPGSRVRTGLHFDFVHRVQTRNIAHDDHIGLLPLLAITAEPGGEGGGVAITLQFAGDGAIRLEAECIDGQLADMSSSWATPRRPDHRLDESGAGA